MAASFPGKLSGLFNCACGEAITLNDVVKSLNEIMGTAIEPIYADARSGDIKYSLASIDLIRERLHFVPKLNFKDGLRQTVPFYQK